MSMKIVFIIICLSFYCFTSAAQDTVKVRFILSDTAASIYDTSRMYIVDTGYVIRKRGWKERKFLKDEGRYENDVSLIGYLDNEKKPFNKNVMIICYYDLKQ